MSSENIADIYNLIKKWKNNLTLLFGNEGKKLKKWVGDQNGFFGWISAPG